MNEARPDQECRRERARGWRIVWLAAAGVNLLGVVAFVAGHDTVYTSAGLPPPSPALHYDTWIAFVFVFGVAYLWVFLDPGGPAARGIAGAGALAKLASATPQLYYLLFRRAETPPLFVVPMAADYLFAALFAWFLWASSPASGQHERAESDGPV